MKETFSSKYKKEILTRQRLEKLCPTDCDNALFRAPLPALRSRAINEDTLNVIPTAYLYPRSSRGGTQFSGSVLINSGAHDHEELVKKGFRKIDDNLVKEIYEAASIEIDAMRVSENEESTVQAPAFTS